MARRDPETELRRLNRGFQKVSGRLDRRAMHSVWQDAVALFGRPPEVDAAWGYPGTVLPD